jgi:hypothetical protein
MEWDINNPTPHQNQKEKRDEESELASKQTKTYHLAGETNSYIKKAGVMNRKAKLSRRLHPA